MIDNPDDPVAKALSQSKPQPDIVPPTKPRTVDPRPVPVGSDVRVTGYEYEFDDDGNIISIEHVDAPHTVNVHTRKEREHDE